MKRIHNDRWGSENLTVILLIVGAVVVVGSLLLGLMNPLFDAGEQAREGPDALTLFGDVSIGAYWVPDTGEEITWTDATDNPLRSTSVMMDFAYGGSTTYLDTVRNNTYYTPGSTDWYRKYDDFVRGVLGSSNTAVSYFTIENETVYEEDGDVYSLVYPGWPYNASTAFLFEFDDDSTEDMVNSQLWANNTFQLYVVWVIGDVDASGELSWYNTAWLIASWQYTPTGTVFDYIFSAFFDMLILTATIVVFSRIFHGG